MSEKALTNQSSSQPTAKKPTNTTSTAVRVTKYMAVRVATLFITVVIAIYLTILIANMGGYVDEIMKSEIRERLALTISMDPANRDLTPEERNKLVDARIALEEDRLGLNQPFAIRSFRYLYNALTLQLGRAQNMTSDSGSKSVRNILLERLPSTLLLMGTANMLLFFMSVYLALTLSRKYGSFWDKLVIAFSPTSAAPPWFYGIFLILIFAALLKVLPFGGIVDAPLPDNPLAYALSVA